MIHNISRYLLTLVALLAMTTGAWADGVKIKFAANGNEKVVTVESLPHTFWCNNDNASDELDLILHELYGWPNNSSNYYCSIFEPYPSASGNDKVTAGIDGDNHYVTIAEGFEGSATVTGQYSIIGGVATYELAISLAEPAGPEVTINDAKTEATMEMPASDVTLEYELVRDLTAGVDLNLLIDQQPVTRARIARVGNGPYQLQGNWQFAAIDKLDAQNPVSLTNGELMYTLKKKDGDGYVAVNTETDLAPGLWRLEATANEGKPYDGTIYSADIELYAVYDLYLSPAQDENVSVTANDKAVSPDAEGKISEVESGKTVKLNVTNADYIIRKATVKGATVSYKVESQFTNGNNYGASTDLKTVLESTDLPVTIKLSDAISFPWDKASEKITNIELQSWGSNPATLSEFSKDGKYVVNPGDVTITFNSLIGATSNTSLLTVSFEGDNGFPQDNNYEIKLSLNQ